VATGTQALQINISGLYNTAVGNGALLNCTGGANTALGAGAGNGSLAPIMLFVSVRTSQART